MRNIFPLIFVLLASGCGSTGVTPAADVRQLSALPSTYRSIIVQKIKSAAKDPYSIRSAEIALPKIGFVGLFNGGNAVVVCVRYNAKNSFGAYVGVEDVLFAFRDGMFLGMLDNHPLACRGGDIYEPFPELEKIS